MLAYLETQACATLLHRSQHKMEYGSLCNICHDAGYIDHSEYCVCDVGQFYEASDILKSIAVSLNELNGYISDEECDETVDMSNIFYLVYLPYNMTEYEGKEF